MRDFPHLSRIALLYVIFFNYNRGKVGSYYIAPHAGHLEPLEPVCLYDLIRDSSAFPNDIQVSS